MFSGHITIQYMFCMYFMIKKIILEGFNDRGEGNLRGRRGKTSKIQKKTSTNKGILAFSRRILDVSKYFCIPKGSGMVPGPGEP